MSRKPSLTYSVATFLGLALYLPFVSTRIEGEHFIPLEGPAILVSNHISFIDPIRVGYLGRRRKRQVHFLAKHGLFKNPISRWFFTACGQIPVERETSRAGDSLLFAAEALKDGRLVGIFPEGTMPDADNFMDQVQLPIKSGALRLAQKTGAPIIVVGAWGAQDTWRKGSSPKLRFRRKHCLVVLPGYYLDPEINLEVAKEELAQKMISATSIARKKLGDQ